MKRQLQLDEGLGEWHHRIAPPDPLAQRRAAESSQHQSVTSINHSRSDHLRDRHATTTNLTHDRRLERRDPIELWSIDLHHRFVIDTEDLRHPALANDLHAPTVLARPAL